MTTPKKNPPKLSSKNNDDPPSNKSRGGPKSSDPSNRKVSSADIRPSATPSQPNTDLPRKKAPRLGSRQSSQVSSNSGPRRPSTVPRRPSNLSGRTSSTDQSRKPPKLPPRNPSEAPVNTSQERKLSTAPRRPSNLAKATSDAPPKRKPPKLGPKEKDAAPSGAASDRKPSVAPKSVPSQAVNQDGAAHQVGEEQQDLKSILSDSQCEDIVRLTADITNRMRRNIEDNFNATATLTKINDEDNGEDKFASVDYDPGTVDVAAYDKERKLRDERRKELSTPKVKELKAASLKWLDDWRTVFLKRVDETINPTKVPALQQAQKNQGTKSRLAATRPVQEVNVGPGGKAQTPPKLEDLYPRVPTPLTKLPMARRTLVLHSFLLLLLSLEHYNAASRIFLLYLASSLKLGLKSLREDEEKTAKGLLEAARQISASKDSLAKGKESEESRRWKMRLATVAGAAIVGLSGGYAAPMIAASVGAMMSELGLGASAAAGYLGSVASNTYLVGSLFGAYGGRMTGEMMRNLSADVEDFAFLPVHGERMEHDDSISAVTDSRRLRVVIAVSGWLLEKEEVVSPWGILKPSAECFALRFEIETLMSLGQSINTMTANDAYGFAESAFTNRSLVTDLSSTIWPIALVKIARVVENPFSLAKARADKAGKVLAETLINRAQGERPVTLVGYSLGARVIWSCLISLAERRAFGLIESVVLLGAPIPSDIGTWRSMRAAVTGRLINVYSRNDYLLAFLYRTSSLQYGIAGLMPISGLSGVENFDVSETVSGHLRYRYLVGSILQRVGFEDIDRDEVAKEAERFKKLTEEEEKNKRNYVEEVKEGAGELYKQYAKRGKQPPTKKISDKEADKQVSAMEKEVQQKTQKGLMQWAVEQLYLSRPTAPSTNDVKNVKSDPQAATKGTTKSVKKTTDAATKSIYQRAKEAVYISRSGGSQGQDAVKNKVADTQGQASSAAPSSYLATAAGCIPTSYMPSFGASGDAMKEPKKATEAISRAESQGSDVALKTAKKKKAKTAPGKPSPKVSKASSDDAKIMEEAGESQNMTGDPEEAAVDADTDPKDKAEDALAKNVEEVSTNEPEASSAVDTPQPVEGKEEDASDSSQLFESAHSQAPKNDTDRPSASKGYSSYIPSLGFMSSSKKSTEAPATVDDPTNPKNKPDSGEDTGLGEGKTEHDGSSHSTPTKAGQSEKPHTPTGKASGYSSYFPSFGFGHPAPSKSSQPDVDDAKGKQKQDDSSSMQDSTDQQKSASEDPFV